jgi:hypothetical protein
MAQSLDTCGYMAAMEPPEAFVRMALDILNAGV